MKRAQSLARQWCRLIFPFKCSLSTLSRPRGINCARHTEYIGGYGPGGYHPIHLGDYLDYRYQILRKLGHGRYATVWLAKDISGDCFVALKVNVSDLENSSKEEKAMFALNAREHEAPLTPRLLNAFTVNGPNGAHRSLVMDALAFNLADLEWHIRYRQSFEPYKVMPTLRSLVRRMLQAVNFVHSRGFVHRDISLHNFMFMLDKSVDHDIHLRQQDGIFAVDELDKNSESRPDYLLNADPLEEFPKRLHPDVADRLVLGDFGATVPLSEANDGNHAFPIDMAPPEVVLSSELSTASDIWALGCTIFRLITHSNLFYVSSFSYGQEQIDILLQSMIETLGPLPKHIGVKWLARSNYVDLEGHLLPERASHSYSDPLELHFKSVKPRDMSEAEVALFEAFLRCMLQFEPKNRWSAKRLLGHAWLA